MKVFAFTVTRATTPQRMAVLNNTLWRGRESAGFAMDWHVWTNGVGNLTMEVLLEALRKNVIAGIHPHGDNVGQHVAWNEAFELAKKEYDYFLRIDDDCEFITKRWLKKLVNCSVMLDDKFVLAPLVRGLKQPPEKSNLVSVKGIPLEFLIGAIGGICRLHPVKLLLARKDPFIADVRKPLGSGDATGVASWCRAHTIPMAYTRQIRVRHNTRSQELDDPEHFLRHDLLQTIPYIPRLDDEQDSNTQQP